MNTRGQFHHEIEEINQDIIQVAKLTEKALNNALNSLYEQDITLANQVIEDDKEIDKKEIDINDKVILLIAKQQPVATDLRRLITALKIVTDLERMADNAKNIARSAIRLGENGETLLPHGLANMQTYIIEMLQIAMESFSNEDIILAAQLSEMDDRVDKQNKLIISELLGETATKPDKIQYIMQVAFCARYLERYADHITNIGESILYLVKGENFNLN
ncbi:MAG: phosphate signaling complex protein PhoU [Bacillota bacterium]|uniref:phosphate signaling complex protein PhoU n=1 Tax=Virgibacillus TaxID=84406 RepID=UPI0004113CCE|nr:MULTISPECIES: phosphate signaling complex protein PhoU [Bacillaceae]MCC2251022.1 phosphate signaling complex protein PhoU [Virgibacillus sp. AGTR]MDY7042754.1 phosphate signaling complex protein PhoU [Virgibacillus sp. M23]QRZ17424.1 phosphate signaling complex protein PhoU [Virgibacillus sp. AGTR]WBX79128.1 phosphate signaling complex protein PhoU [Virgibacillus salarius]